MRIALCLLVVLGGLTSAAEATPWSHGYPSTDNTEGVGVTRVFAEMSLVEPSEPIVVAVIDTGFDLNHPDLRDRLWTNPGEADGQPGVDDDGNGWIDDEHGWNLLGSRDGRRQVVTTSLEVAREWRRLLAVVASGAASDTERAQLRKVARELGSSRRMQLTQLMGAAALLDQGDAAMLRLAEAGVDPFDDDAIAVASQAGGAASGAARAVQQWRAYGMDGADVQSALRGAALSLAYHLDGSRDPSAIIGDDPTDLNERGYGNPQIDGENAYHGTHVAGIIGALRDGQGAEGICPWVRLMPIVAVPDGDERDKDVANAIRYAVDNGARIICCSFGKGWSPDQAVVDAAARYAEAKGVLIVHAAGNEGTNLDETPHYPIPWTNDDDGTRRHLTNWIEVGASGPEANRDLAAEFSNYGSESVDLFAPGVEIPSSILGGGVGNASGTSMAAPTVAGVAALVWSQHPELSASELRERLVRTARQYPSKIVKRPGDGALVPFSHLSQSGGILDAWAALSDDQAVGDPSPEPVPEP